MKVAVYGAGALGTLVSAYLTRAGIDVTVIGHIPEHIDALNKNGARVTGLEDFTVPVKAINQNELRDEMFDVIFLTNHRFRNEVGFPALVPRLKEDGTMVSLQHGLPEPKIMEMVGSNRTIGATIEFGYSLRVPGVCEVDSSQKGMSIHIGRMPGVSSGQLSTVRGMLELICKVHYEKDLLASRWSLLIVNCSLSGLADVIGGSWGMVIKHRRTRMLAIDAMNEVIRVGRASGANFNNLWGHDLSSMFYCRTGLKKLFCSLIMRRVFKNHLGIVPTVLQDLHSGRLTEIHRMNGVIVEMGEKYGVPTPVNAKILELVHEAEKGEIPISYSNVKEF